MKLFNRILLGLLVVLAVSCSERELPYVDFDGLTYGAYARVEEGPTGIYNYLDVPSSKLDFRVEFYDENQGKNVASYAWTVEYIDKINGGSTSIGKRPFRTFNAPFEVNSRGLPGVTTSFTLQEALNALGVTIDQLDGGSTIRFEAIITKTDGSTFSISNTDGNLIAQVPFKALFRIDANLICPSSIGGEIDYVNTNMQIGDGSAGAPCGPSEISGTVVWAPITGKVGEYAPSDFSFGQYDSCWDDAPATSASARIIDACNIFSTDGGDQYGIVYTYNIVSINGPVMVIDWSNDYFDSGRVTLTRKDNADWPPLRN
jgi:hypothetical protein